jgi:hypothetical protein
MKVCRFGAPLPVLRAIFIEPSSYLV